MPANRLIATDISPPDCGTYCFGDVEALKCLQLRATLPAGYGISPMAFPMDYSGDYNHIVADGRPEVFARPAPSTLT